MTALDYPAVRARLDRRCRTELDWSLHDSMLLYPDAVVTLAGEELDVQRRLQGVR